MTVLLVGIGADTTNCSPTPPVFVDGRFEYVPIPESCGPDGTTEHRTYGNTGLRHTDGPLSRLVNTVFPNGRAGPRITGSDLATWPLHFDPNLDALTYGETASRPAYVHRLRTLKPGDVVAFYTGLQRSEHAPRHRYLIGAFTVRSILDCQAVSHKQDTVSFQELPRERQTALMDDHHANAHAKRFVANGQIVAADDGLIIVDGTEPGGLFSKALRISADPSGPHHYLRPDLHTRWSPEPGGNPATTAYLGGVKPAHLLNVDPGTFWSDVSAYR